MSRFFIKPLTDRRKLARHTPWAGVHREQQERVKNKTDAVQQQFYRVRYLAGVRCNQARRLYAAATEAIAFVEKTQRSYPHEFSYEETVQTPSGRAVRQRVELTLWDAVSVREHAIGLGYAEAPDTTRQRRWREGRYSEARVPHYVEYNATVSLGKTMRGGAFLVSGAFSPSCLPARRSARRFRSGGQARAVRSEMGIPEPRPVVG